MIRWCIAPVKTPTIMKKLALAIAVLLSAAFFQSCDKDDDRIIYEEYPYTDLTANDIRGDVKTMQITVCDNAGIVDGIPVATSPSYFLIRNYGTDGFMTSQTTESYGPAILSTYTFQRDPMNRIASILREAHSTKDESLLDRSKVVIVYNDKRGTFQTETYAAEGDGFSLEPETIVKGKLDQYGWPMDAEYEGNSAGVSRGEPSLLPEQSQIRIIEERDFRGNPTFYCTMSLDEHGEVNGVGYYTVIEYEYYE